MMSKRFFSKLMSVEEFRKAFGRGYSVVSHDESSQMPKVNLEDAIFDGYEPQVAIELYNSYFRRGKMRVVAKAHVPRCLKGLLLLMWNCKMSGTELTSNGAGKQFVYLMLSLSIDVGECWFVKTSTTNDPRTDWCGVPVSRVEPTVMGVVDAEVVSHGGRCFLVAEVKSTIAIEAAECQLMAEMEMIQLHQSGESVLGLLVPTSNRLQFTCITRNLNSLGEVLWLMDVAFGCIREWDRNPRLLQHHVKESAPYGAEVILARLSKVEDKVDKIAEQVARLVTTMGD